MRPIALTMTAFGPYAAEQRIDFRELGEKRFFLIHGPTGAGKTSILDAMTFALYGDTSGEDRSGAEMRSDLAESGDLTEVVFDFAIGPDAYRVSRQPAQERPKQRGEGFTKVAPAAALWRRTGLVDDADEGEVVATGVSKVDAAVVELLGFSDDQFRQVVVLPQGKFREVLGADVRKREEILRQLFGTGRFARITEFLKTKRGEVEREIRDAQVRRTSVLQSAGVETVEALSELQRVTAQRAQTAERVRADAQASCDRLQRERDEARQIVDAMRELTDATFSLEALQARAPEFAEQRAQLDAARRALGVDVARRERDKRRAESVSATASVTEFETALPKVADAYDNACELAEMAEKTERENLEIERLASKAADAERAAADLEAVVQAASAVEARERDALMAAEQAQRLQEACESAEATVREVEQAWRSGRAAALAAGLGEGEPCPVCGSVDHPELAPQQGEAADEHAIERARARAQTARREHAAVREALAAAEQSVAGAKERLAEVEARVPNASSDAKAARAQAQALASELAQRSQAARKAEADLRHCREERDRAQRALAASTAKLEYARKHLEAAKTAADEAESQFLEALENAHLADEAALEAVCLTGVEIDALEGAVEAFERALSSARDRQQRAQEAAAKAPPLAPDLAALDERVAKAQAEFEGATREAASVAKDRERLTDAMAALSELDGQTGELRKRFELVARLANVAQGDNPLKLSLQRYVLGTYLDEVLEHASYRLLRMTGRYRLQRATGANDLRRAAGLDLAVFDELSGKERPAGTLSGGEGFQASLALALGMAEAVQAHAGGVRLETIFIDEGFGTLDPDSLEAAIGTLLELANVAAGQGRLVGIISHVPELQRRIDARLEVVPGERGSTARFVV